jgi:hypothetical protein
MPTARHQFEGTVNPWPLSGFRWIVAALTAPTEAGLRTRRQHDMGVGGLLASHIGFTTYAGMDIGRDSGTGGGEFGGGASVLKTMRSDHRSSQSTGLQAAPRSMLDLSAAFSRFSTAISRWAHASSCAKPTNATPNRAAGPARAGSS